MSAPHAEREVWIRCGSCRRGLFRCHGRGTAGEWVIASGRPDEPDLFYDWSRVTNAVDVPIGTPYTNAKIRCPKCHREHAVNFQRLLARIEPETTFLLLGDAR